jgi:predicted adenine nucleotide alpha hydrolase (AANH) superfamily ATPase
MKPDSNIYLPKKDRKELLLIHTCCAPCLTIPVLRLSDKFSIVSYYYNPNIHPYTEYKTRLEALEKFANLKKISLVFEKFDYASTKKFISTQLKEDEKGKKERCLFCYEERIKKTVEFALEHGYKIFTTSLLTSPYQYHDEIRSICESYAKKFGLTFIYEDFRKDYKKSIELCKEYDIYRQKYCGCVFSEFERYLKIKG